MMSVRITAPGWERHEERATLTGVDSATPARRFSITSFTIGTDAGAFVLPGLWSRSKRPKILAWRRRTRCRCRESKDMFGCCLLSADGDSRHGGVTKTSALSNRFVMAWRTLTGCHRGQYGRLTVIFALVPVRSCWRSTSRLKIVSMTLKQAGKVLLFQSRVFQQRVIMWVRRRLMRG